MNESIDTTIRQMAAPLATSLGLEIWGVDVVFGKHSLVRVFVESENGVDIDKCAELSRLLGLTLEVEDIVPDAYVLEVSSPGLERIFFTPEQLAAHAGQTVEISLHNPVEAYPGRRKLLGTLAGVENDFFSVTLLDAPKSPGSEAVPATFTWSDIKKAKLVHFLPEAPNAPKGRKLNVVKKSGKPVQQKANGEAGADTTA